MQVTRGRAPDVDPHAVGRRVHFLDRIHRPAHVLEDAPVARRHRLQAVVLVVLVGELRQLVGEDFAPRFFGELRMPGRQPGPALFVHLDQPRVVEEQAHPALDRLDFLGAALRRATHSEQPDPRAPPFLRHLQRCREVAELADHGLVRLVQVEPRVGVALRAARAARVGREDHQLRAVVPLDHLGLVLQSPDPPVGFQ
jgi:hypothetical protein